MSLAKIEVAASSNGHCGTLPRRSLPPRMKEVRRAMVEWVKDHIEEVDILKNQYLIQPLLYASRKEAAADVRAIQSILKRKYNMDTETRTYTEEGVYWKWAIRLKK